MNKTYAQWKKQVDEFDAVIDTIPALGESVLVWGVFCPAVPALYDAVIRELDSYKMTSGRLRGWLITHEKADGDPVEFGENVRATIFAARRLKGLIDAYNREKVVAEASYPELAGGSLKDSGVGGLEPRVPPRDTADTQMKENDAVHEVPRFQDRPAPKNAPVEHGRS